MKLSQLTNRAVFAAHRADVPERTMWRALDCRFNAITNITRRKTRDSLAIRAEYEAMGHDAFVDRYLTAPFLRLCESVYRPGGAWQPEHRRWWSDARIDHEREQAKLARNAAAFERLIHGL